MLEELNARFDSAWIRFVDGQGGLPKAILETRDSEAEVYLHGGHVTRFQVVGTSPVLWMSDDAVFDGKKALRGGIPLVFPWFGAHPTDSEKPQHGFARNSSFEVLAAAGSDDFTSLELGLNSTPATKELWPYDFQLTLSVQIEQFLKVSLRVQNTGRESFEVSPALHTYFSVSNIRSVSMMGFEGTEYIDQLQDGTRLRQSGPVTFDQEIDRVYLNPESDDYWETSIHDPAKERVIEVSNLSKSAVVWNPWIAKSQRMGDFPDDGYESMVCIEAANAADDRRVVESGETHELCQMIRVAPA